MRTHSDKRAALAHLSILQKHQVGGDPETAEGIIDLLFRKNPAAIEAIFGVHRVLAVNQSIFFQSLLTETETGFFKELQSTLAEEGTFTRYESLFTSSLLALFSTRLARCSHISGLPYVEPVLGTLSLGDANAATFRSPDGTPIIALNSGLYAFLLKLSAILGRSFTLDRAVEGGGAVGTQGAVSEEQLAAFTQLWVDYGAHGYVSDPALNILEAEALPGFPVTVSLFSYLFMFVLAHEHAHIILARAGSPSEGALQEEIDADNYALRICLSYANTPGRGPSEPAIAVAAAQVFLQLIELRRMASKEPHRDSHPSTAERQAALFLTVATSHAALYQAAVDVSRALHGIVAKLWNLSYPAIARGIATAPPIARFSDETLRYIWFVAGTARGKALGSGAAEEARQPGDPRLRLASEVGIVAKTGQLVDAANLTLDERRAYDRAFEVTRDPVHLSMFDAGRKAALQKAASNLVSPEKARERAEAGTDNEESRARMTESWIKGAEAYERRDFLEAASHLESARDVGAKLASPAECIEITTLFARSLHEVGQLARALPLFQQLVDYNKNFYGPRHWRTAEAQNNLGLLLKDSGNALDAESMLREALHLMEDHFGPLHSKVGTVVGNLALALHAGGHSADSIPFFTRAIDIHVECHGAKSLEVGRDQSNLAQALLDQQRWTEAEGMLREALAATESVLGPDDPLVARRLNNLSRALLGGGKFEEASQEIQRALSIHERRFGRKNFERAAMLSNLGSVFVATGQLSEAEEAMREALSIDVDVLDPQHPALARELCNLAFVLVQQNSREAGPLIEAESLARESLRIAEAGFGAESRNLVPILNTLALILIRRGQDEAASALERRVAQLTEG